MEVIVEIILEVFGEILLQVVFEALASAGIHLFKGDKDKAATRNPWLMAIGYAIFGAVAGGISLWVMPTSFIRSHAFRMIYVVLAPLLVGALFAAIGRWRSQRGQAVLMIDRFACGSLFALAFAAIRFTFAK